MTEGRSLSPEEYRDQIAREQQAADEGAWQRIQEQMRADAVEAARHSGDEAARRQAEEAQQQAGDLRRDDPPREQLPAQTPQPESVVQFLRGAFTGGGAGIALGALIAVVLVTNRQKVAEVVTTATDQGGGQ